MKKIFVALTVFILAALVLIIPGVAADTETENGARICFVADTYAVRGCASNSSYLDNIINAASGKGYKIAVFFKTDGMKYDADLMYALLKLNSAGFLYGITASGSEDVDAAVQTAWIYQKYITKSVSRLVLESRDEEIFGDEFAVCKYDVYTSDPVYIDSQQIFCQGDGVVAVEVTWQTTPAITRIFKRASSGECDLITPTAVGFAK